MKDLPLVSVLLPVYQVEEYIERCARSVFEQTYQNLEFVFVDDGSTDSSIDLLKSVINDYHDLKDNIHIIRHLENKGLAAARNTAIKSCHGDFVIHVDSDDWIEPIAVQSLVQKQQETKADIVYTRGNFLETNESVKIDCRGWSTDKETLLTNFLQDKATICLWSKLIKRSLYTKHAIRCDERGSYYEDYQSLARLIYYSHTIACLDAYIYHYDRSNPGSIVSNIPYNTEIQKQGLISIQVVCDFFQDKEQRYLELVKRFYMNYLNRLETINQRNETPHDNLPDRKA